MGSWTPFASRAIARAEAQGVLCFPRGDDSEPLLLQNHRAPASAGARHITKRSKKSILLLPKMSDLEAPTTNSGGRKARPYEGQVNPFGRGGVYPRPQRTDRSANPCIGIAQFRYY